MRARAEVNNFQWTVSEFLGLGQGGARPERITEVSVPDFQNSERREAEQLRQSKFVAEKRMCRQIVIALGDGYIGQVEFRGVASRSCDARQR